MHTPTLLAAFAALLAADIRSIFAIADNPCRFGEPCHVGSRYGDAEDCTLYYECTTSGFISRACPVGKTFHVRKENCTKFKPACARSCKSELRRLSKRYPRDEPVVNNATFSTSVIMAVITTPAVEVTTKQAVTTTSSTTPTTTTPTTTTTTPSTTVTSPPTTTISPKTEPPTTTSTIKTTSALTTARVSVVIGVDRNAPQGTDKYHVITDAATTAVVSTPGDGKPALPIGPIIGAAVGGVVLLLLIIIIAVCIRRRRYNSHRRIPKVENPQYNQPPQSYRFSQDSAIYLRNTINNNSLLEKPSKRKAPRSPDQSNAIEMNTLQKRKAPPPPNPFTMEIDNDTGRSITDLYEKDSMASSEHLGMSTFTARNDTANSSYCGEQSGDERGTHGTTEDCTTEDGTEDGTDDEVEEEEEEEEEIEEDDAPLVQKLNDTQTASSDDNEDGSSSEDDASEDVSDNDTSMSKQTSNGNLSRSVDEYDKTLNPFYTS